MVHFFQAGAIRGALEMTHIEVACWFVQVLIRQVRNETAVLPFS
jgi:hypothetical protein